MFHCEGHVAAVVNLKLTASFVVVDFSRATQITATITATLPDPTCRVEGS